MNQRIKLRESSHDQVDQLDWRVKWEEEESKIVEEYLPSYSNPLELKDLS